MPLRLPRLTVRRLMILVALVGLAIGGWVEAIRLRRLSLSYSEEAWTHEFLEGPTRLAGEQSHEDWVAHSREVDQVNQGGGTQMGSHIAFLGHTPPPDVMRKKADHHHRMWEKYMRAARYPWLAVEPDPPEPDWDGVVRP